MSDPLSHNAGSGFVEDTPVQSLSSKSVTAPVSRKEAQAQSFRLQQQREQQELVQVLSTDAGQAIILRMLDQAGIYSPAILSEADQGRRALGMWLVHRINEIPGAYPALLTAHAKRQEKQREIDAVSASNARGA